MCGEPGIGKSELFAVANLRSTDRGMQVLTATGVQSEAHLPFAGLHQLLRPRLARGEGSPVRQRVALLAAFGMTDAAAPDRFLIALAALDLLADTAARSPLLLVVEDAQWLDRPTGDVLAFVARRLGSEPIVLLTALREGQASALGMLDCRSCAWKDSMRRRQPRCWPPTLPRLPRESANACSPRRRATPRPPGVTCRAGIRPARRRCAARVAAVDRTARACLRGAGLVAGDPAVAGYPPRR